MTEHSRRGLPPALYDVLFLMIFFFQFQSFLVGEQREAPDLAELNINLPTNHGKARPVPLTFPVVIVKEQGNGVWIPEANGDQDFDNVQQLNQLIGSHKTVTLLLSKTTPLQMVVDIYTIGLNGVEKVALQLKEDL